MKTLGIYLYIIALTVLSAVSANAATAVATETDGTTDLGSTIIRVSGDVTYLDAIKFEDTQVVKVGDNVTVSMKIVLDSTRIKTQHTISLTPIIVSDDEQTEWELETVIIDGRRRNKVYLRSEALDSVETQRATAQAILKRINRTEQEYLYSSSVPYEMAMLDGKVKLHECVKGCANCGQGESETGLEDMMETYCPTWKTDTIGPRWEEKIREVSKSSRIQFNVDKSDIVPGLGNNKTELDSVKNSIAIVQERSYLTITKVHIVGYASPEASFEYNYRLSTRRANSYAEYIIRENKISRDYFVIDSGGENWEGLKRDLQASDYARKDTVIAIIDKYTDDRNLCETVMRSTISLDDYLWMYRTIYPSLRECVYTIEYNVKNFNLEEAKQVIRDNPKDLNLAEMQMVAGAYEPGSEEYNYALETIAEFYPDEPASLSYRAEDLLQKEDYKGVQKLLKDIAGEKAEDADKAVGNPVLVNVYGVACARLGEYDSAEAAFRKAADSDYQTAKDNLVELMNVVAQLDPASRGTK